MSTSGTNLVNRLSTQLEAAQLEHDVFQWDSSFIKQLRKAEELFAEIYAAAEGIRRDRSANKTTSENPAKFIRLTNKFIAIAEKDPDVSKAYQAHALKIMAFIQQNLNTSFLTQLPQVERIHDEMKKAFKCKIPDITSQNPLEFLNEVQKLFETLSSDEIPRDGLNRTIRPYANFISKNFTTIFFPSDSRDRINYQYKAAFILRLNGYWKGLGLHLTPPPMVEKHSAARATYLRKQFR